MSNSKLVLPLIGLLAFFSLAAVGCNQQTEQDSPTVSDVLEQMVEKQVGDSTEEKADDPAMDESITEKNFVEKENNTTNDSTEDFGESVEEEAKKVVQDPTPPISTVRTFEMVARQWDFDPATITVNEGDMVIISIKSVDVAHGFSISAFGVNERIDPGTASRIEFIADKKGTYSFVCSVFCAQWFSATATAT